jgi:thioredoxin-related protein
MKKAWFIFLGIVVVFAGGCKKKPAEPVSAPPVSVELYGSQPGDNTPQANSESVSAVEKTAAQPVTRPEWMTDFEAARKRAAAENKDLFLNFSGSDWCGWCQALDKEVFSEKLFINEAKKYFVFVLLDFPQSKKQSEEIRTQNSRLAQRYRVDGFPTIILADAAGKPYAETGYQKGGPMVYLQHLAELRMKKPAK